MNAQKTIGSVHRFRDKVAVYIGNGETVYLTPKAARAFARAFNACARDIALNAFVDSPFRTVEVKQ